MDIENRLENKNFTLVLGCITNGKLRRNESFTVVTPRNFKINYYWNINYNRR